MFAANRWALMLLPAAALWLGGCDTLAYYGQAVDGHAQLMHRTRPIEQRIADPDTPTGLRARLRRVLEIRDFASRELALPDNDSYRRFADVPGEAVVWTLVATPEFSVQPLQWCYPVIGCAAYRGYFERRAALAKAADLGARGRDWTVEPVAAYSTLGWFDDPLPGPVLDWPEPRLAGLIFHELAHQQLYLADDSVFNEAFASAVENVGVQRWLAARGDARGLADWRRYRQRLDAFVALLGAARERLQVLYRQALPVAELRRAKQRVFDRLRGDYGEMAARQGGEAPFRAWFARPLNNARLALVNTYEQWRPAFEALLDCHEGDFPAFFEAVRQLAEAAPDRRRRVLRALAASQEPRRSCP